MPSNPIFINEFAVNANGAGRVARNSQCEIDISVLASGFLVLFPTASSSGSYKESKRALADSEPRKPK